MIDGPHADPRDVRHPIEFVCAAIAALAFAALAIAAPATPLVMTVVGWAAITIAIASLIRIGISRPLADQVRDGRRELVELRSYVHRREAHDAVIARLDLELVGAATEADVRRLLTDALSGIEPHRDAVMVQAACIALASRTPAISATSAAPGACAHLARGDADLEVSSVCLPLGSSNPVAAVCSLGPVGEVPPTDVVAAFASIARRAGDRIAAIGRSTAAGDDPVEATTGLPPREAVTRTLTMQLAGHHAVAVALIDLDGWPQYVAEHGEVGGDRIARCVADAICCTVRPHDVVARDSDDRFLVAFPGCTARDATVAMERVREALILEAAEEQIAGITASVGVASSERHSTVDEMVEAADVAVVVARQQGGNRIVRSDFSRSG